MSDNPVTNETIEIENAHIGDLFNHLYGRLDDEYSDYDLWVLDEIRDRLAPNQLLYLDYIDWDVGKDDKLRLGDYVNCNYQYPDTGMERNLQGLIVSHPKNGMPVLEIEDNFHSLEQLFLDGWTFQRITNKAKMSTKLAQVFDVPVQLIEKKNE